MWYCGYRRSLSSRMMAQELNCRNLMSNYKKSLQIWWREEETVLTDRWTAYRSAASVLGPRTDSQGEKWIKDNIQYRIQHKYL
jgi:hypothetical protein